VSQSNTGQAHVAETLTQETRTFIRQVRTRTHRRYAPEDKVRIVLEGSRREVSVSGLCRREGIKPGVFYAWAKGSMEAGKERLTRDTVRDATRQETGHLKREDYDLKQLVSNPSGDIAPPSARLDQIGTKNSNMTVGVVLLGLSLLALASILGRNVVAFGMRSGTSG